MTDPNQAQSRRILVLLAVSAAVLVAAALALRSTVGAGRMANVPVLAFHAFSNAPPEPGADPLIPCDLDGDGRTDFISTVQPRPLVWFSRGDGTFDHVHFPFGGPNEVPLVLGDFDGDTTADFLLTDQADKYLVLRGFDFVWPTGEFPPDPNALPAGHPAPDGGGRPLQRQEGVFRSVSYVASNGLVGPGVGAHVLAQDFDGNRVADVLIQPGRDLPEPTEEPPLALGKDLPWPRFYDPTRGYFTDAASAAGKPQLEPEPVNFAELRMNLLTEKAVLIRMAHASALHAAYTNLLGGDFTGDKRGDFVRQPKGRFAAKGDPALLYIGEGSGFRVERIHALNEASARVDSTFNGDEVHLETADFDGDGKLDLLWKRLRGFVEGKARLQIWLSRGDGAFVVVEPQGVDTLWYAESTRIYAGDIDGDGKADLVVQDTRQPSAAFAVQQVAVAR